MIDATPNTSLQSHKGKQHKAGEFNPSLLGKFFRQLGRCTVRAALQSSWNVRRHLGLYQCLSLDHFVDRN